MEESIVLEVYPKNKGMVIVSLDEVKLPFYADFRTVKVYGKSDEKSRKPIKFSLISKKGFKNILKYNQDIPYTHIAILNNGSGKIEIVYRISKNKKMVLPKNNRDNSLRLVKKDSCIFLQSGNKNCSLLIDNRGAIKDFTVYGLRRGPLHLVSYGGEFFRQEQSASSNVEIITDDSFVKIIKFESSLKILGKKSKKNGILPFCLEYTFWSDDGKNIYCNAEIELRYDEAVSLNGEPIKFLDCMLWFRLEGAEEPEIMNTLSRKNFEKSLMSTLNHPYGAVIYSGEHSFGMFPYLALPCDGIHIEKGEKFFGAAWHSLPEKSSPYWIDLGLEGDKKSDLSQGYFPAQSLRSYWKIGFYFGGGEKLKNASEIFSYPAKIRNAAHLSEEVGNAYISRWKDNKKLALHAMTDDAKANDYFYRCRGAIPKWVQMSLSTRNMFGVNYHRFCFVGKKLFFLQKLPSLSTILSTLFCAIGIGVPLRQKFRNDGLSFLPHMNTHPKFYALGPVQIKKEIITSEKVWASKFNFGQPVSHILSWTATYGLTTSNGTRESVAFSSSKTVQWLREWPIPNAPLDFFLPTKLYWGIAVGEMFNEKNIKKLKDEFNSRLEKGADYMIAAGHAPQGISECAKSVSEFFSYVESKNDVWTASADEIIRYYKCRENIFLSRTEKNKEHYEIEAMCDIKDFLHSEVTLMQFIKDCKKKIVKISYTIDGSRYIEAEHRFVDGNENKNLVMYDVPSKSKKIRVSVRNK